MLEANFIYIVNSLYLVDKSMSRPYKYLQAATKFESGMIPMLADLHQLRW